MVTHIKVTENNKYPKSLYKRDEDMSHMYSYGEIRILTPDEYHKLRDTIPQDRHKTLLDVLLITGMRYIEVCRLWDNPKWFNEKRNLIHLPPEAQKKHKRSQLERTIQPLPSMFNYILRDFWEARKPPSESSWNRDLRNWAMKANLAPYGLSAKTTRKTIESWLVAGGVNETRICLRAGHDNLTSMRHYQNLAFNDSELNDIKKQLIAWGMLT